MTTPPSDLPRAAAELLRNAFDRDATGAAVAPGRVNLIGEHTDYNEGFVLPMAINRGTVVAFAPRDDQRLRVVSAGYGAPRELDLATLTSRAISEPERHRQRGGWFSYVAGVAWAMAGAGIPLRGADFAVVTDLPTGAGLSSSAALEIGVARALTAVSGAPWNPVQAAQLAQRAEHEFAGVACGIMDQLVVAATQEGTALLIDCRSLETRPVPMPAAARIVIFDTGVRRSLARSEYNDRREACARAVEHIRSIDASVEALRDVSAELLARARPLLDDTTYRRAAHVVAENARPHALADAFAREDLATAGRLLNESHASLRDLYEVSCPELDVMVELATAETACFGARMTGAGFGGCAIALTTLDTDTLVRRVSEDYHARTKLKATPFVCHPSPGAYVVSFTERA
jgi:galactokinase